MYCVWDAGMDAMPRPTVDWIRDFMHTPVNHKPGTAFMYNSTGSSILGAIVRKKTGEGLQEYLSKRLFCKIGIDPDNIRWYCMPDKRWKWAAAECLPPQRTICV